MSIGYIVFMTEGLIAAIHLRQIDGPDRVKAIWSHALLQLRALVCILIGFGVIYRNKAQCTPSCLQVLLGKPHFMSLHAKFGLATLVLSILMPLWGLVSFRRMGLIQRFPERWQPLIKTLHRQLGALTWLLALVTIELALPHPAVAKGHLTVAWQVGSTESVVVTATGDNSSSRRQFLLGVAGLSTLVLQGDKLAVAAGNNEVGNYLPPYGEEDFVLFVPNKAKTPALRAGTVDNLNPYRFALPPNFVEQKVANIQSGNYCQPRCDEPWTEVIFEGVQGGRVELIVAPLQKLTPRKNIKVEDLGTPEQLLQRVGNYITGTYLDEDALVGSSSKVQDGLTYYFYELDAPYAKVAAHSYTACTVKGDLAFLFVASTSEKQWGKLEGRLRKVVGSFRA
ncbi:hypothetical protein GPECTOR_61g815 [Gonium pectorale]|uniref:Cytochrome b561 domain-containing protein n=1 Tax=Gonium pectorale TaxID=33097 RepID=A0A150G4S4_GONPE|nr:hypothetical protein GPECTOR_61g815 [Gonium pectorale]|eukprot:KXZ44862.1 hypothetical protein GPECTOR_61g815 [Gonium pectorale]